MRSIETIVKESWFRKKPWLILGTGETLDRYDPRMADKYNIWTINCAIDVPGYADVFHFQDVYAAQSMYGNGERVTCWPTNYRYCAIRPTVRREVEGSLFTPDNAIAIYYDRDCDSAKIKKPPGEMFPLSNSTSFAFLFLSRYCREVYTLGIDDGSNWIAKGVNERYVKDREVWRETVPHETWEVENMSNNGWLTRNKSKQIRLGMTEPEVTGGACWW